MNYYRFVLTDSLFKTRLLLYIIYIVRFSPIINKKWGIRKKINKFLLAEPRKVRNLKTPKSSESSGDKKTSRIDWIRRERLRLAGYRHIKIW